MSRGPIVATTGGSGAYMVAILHFDSLAAIQSAFATLEGRARGADRRRFAPNNEDLIMLLFEDREV